MISETILRIASNSQVAGIIISITEMMFFGYLATRVTKRLRLPNVTAYIVTGILLGPYVFHLVPAEVISGMDFLSDIALAFIAFSTGEFFRLETLKKNGPSVALITIMEAVLASILVFIVTFFFLGISLPFSIVLAALASATAPASTIMTIRQTGAKGDFVDTLLQVVALDDVVGLVEYSVAISIAVAAMQGGSIRASSILQPILLNAGVLLLGGLFGVFLRLFMIKKHTDDNRLIIVLSLLFAFCGICAILDVSPLLGCMSFGMVYINISDDEKLFRQLGYFTPPILLMFFVRSGLSFNLSALTDTGSRIGRTSLLTVGIVYFLVRIIGKYSGAFAGCQIVGKQQSVRNYLGLALIPQAGVAIGLAMLGARTLGGEMGEALKTIILASSVLYELVGPACAKASLYLSHSYPRSLEDRVAVEEKTSDGREKTAAELLVERIQSIQEEMRREENVSPEEEAFEEAAEENYAAIMGKIPENTSSEAVSSNEAVSSKEKALKKKSRKKALTEKALRKKAAKNLKEQKNSGSSDESDARGSKSSGESAAKDSKSFGESTARGSKSSGETAAKNSKSFGESAARGSKAPEKQP